MAKQTKKAEKQVKTLLFRVPVEVFNKVKSRADEQKRSVNSQMVYELDEK